MRSFWKQSGNINEWFGGGVDECKYFNIRMWKQVSTKTQMTDVVMEPFWAGSSFHYLLVHTREISE